MKRSVWSIVVLAIIASLTIAIEPAFAATTYSFTTAGATGRTGPTQAQVNTAYTGTSLAGLVTINTQGVQEWTVPASGRYQIVAAGASGARGGSNTTSAGKGVVQTIEISLTSGTVLKLIVGQVGLAGTHVSGGGGGSFIASNLSDTYPLIASGGGGGGGYSGSSLPAGINGSTSQSGTNANGLSSGGGVNGQGGTMPTGSSNYGGGGAGWLGNGVNGLGGSCEYTPVAAAAVSSGGVGGRTNGSAGGDGGFGGGGASTVMCGASGAGGGGGYSGGGPSNSNTGPYTGGGGGGSYYSNSATLISAAATNTSAGYITITSLGPSLVSFSPRTSITNASTITYDLTFSENVTGLAASDFSKSGSGSSTCTIGSPSGSNASYVITLTGCSPGTVILTIAANAVTNAVPQTAPSSNTDAATVVIDQTAPTISSVSAPANSTYKPADTPTFTMAFSESVTITGTPRLTLTVGSSTEYANFVSMSDSKTALFRYTVATDPIEFDTDGIAIATSLDLNSGSIADLASNALTNLTFTAPTLTSVLVAQPAAAPTIDSITATSGQLAIYFTAGAARGSTTSNYQYTTNNGGTWTNRPTGTTASPLTLTGLSNGTGYTIRIRAVTNAGNSDSSTAVTETPTAIIVTGDATLTLTYGSSASTGAYSASGGTNTFTWSLGSVISGITLSGTTVTASSSTPAGTFTQTVRATDGAAQVGSKTLTITVNKASTSISIALQGGGTDTPVGASPVIAITTPRAGTVAFSTGGMSITACASITIASTSGTCTLTAPNSTGSITLVAIFTPTDSSNYETSSATLTLNIVNGVSTVTLSLAGGVTQTPKGKPIVITASIDQAGRIAFFADGKRIAGCINKVVASGNRTCSWTPTIQKEVTITVTLNPTNPVYQNSSQITKVWVVRRSGTR